MADLKEMIERVERREKPISEGLQQAIGATCKRIREAACHIAPVRVRLKETQHADR